ncbi:hypothetical protein RJ640_005037 [Escallonia rubra]|uniref:Uncharacterized protein n=1 Tax=Escallonia rubra TaxID=112253 RepID=A0AA88UEA5_9ASTE|nr:hypothetical protein RJ640_005037 [Escallonia rubra]
MEHTLNGATFVLPAEICRTMNYLELFLLGWAAHKTYNCMYENNNLVANNFTVQGSNSNNSGVVLVVFVTKAHGIATGNNTQCFPHLNVSCFSVFYLQD